MDPIVPRQRSATPGAELLRLVGAVRRLGFDRNPPRSEAMGRIGDAFRAYDGMSDNEC